MDKAEPMVFGRDPQALPNVSIRDMANSNPFSCNSIARMSLIAITFGGGFHFTAQKQIVLIDVVKPFCAQWLEILTFAAA